MIIKIDGLKINYKTFGKGKPFLILHGWGSSIERWEKVAEAISKKGYKVIVPDMPGFGKSDAPEVAWEINDYLKWLEKFIKTQKSFNKNFYLLGHSFGGALASVYAINHKIKTKKLFLVASAGIRKKTLKKTLLADIAHFFKNFKNIPPYNLARKIFYKYFVGRTDYLNVKESMKDTYLKVISKDLSGELQKINVSTVIIWGEKDNVTPVEDAYYMDKVIKKSKLIIIPDASHALNVKQDSEGTPILAKEILNNL